MSALGVTLDRLLYRVLLTLLSPLLLLVALNRGAGERGRGQFLRERLGFLSFRYQQSIWVHAVSVGEVQAAASLLRELRVRYPELPLVVTTGTATGAARARAILGESVAAEGAAAPSTAMVCFLPLDLPGAVTRFFAHVRPRLAIIVEKELWPNLYRGCLERRIPLVLASATVRARSADRYRRLWRLCGAHTRESLWVAAQSAEEAERFAAIGVPRECIAVIGNLKFDAATPTDAAASRVRLRSVLGLEGSQAGVGERLVVVAGSTYEVEESALLAAQHRLLTETGPTGRGCEFLLVLAPRHPQRFETVAAHLARAGRPWLRWSQVREQAAAAAVSRTVPQVLLLDTLGELAEFYTLADVAYVGGTLLSDVGGHNALEPAALGVPILAGPHGYNAPAVFAALREAGGLVIVAEPAQLAESLRDWLQHPAARSQAGHAAKEFVAAHRGALARLLDGIAPLIEPPISAATSRSTSR